MGMGMSEQQVHQVLVNMVNAGTIPAAAALAETLRGANLETAQNLATGLTFFGTVAQRRQQLVGWAIGYALNHVAIRYTTHAASSPEYVAQCERERAAYLDSYRRDHLAMLGVAS